MEVQEKDENQYFSCLDLLRHIGIQMALRNATELDVFNIISNSGPQAQLTATEIVSKIPTSNPNAAAANLDRILRMLGTNSLLTMSSKPCPKDEAKQEICYGLTKKTRSLVTNSEGVSLAPMLLMSSSREVVDSLCLLKQTVLEPDCCPFNKVHGVGIFEYASKELGMNKLLNMAMGSGSKMVVDAVLKVYKGFEEVEEIMDVGGGVGTSLSRILSVYPNIRGINFDLAHVIADAPDQQGVTHVVGDMFESLPKAQSIFLKWVLHDWDDDRCKKLLKNCWEALPDCGRAIAVEFIVPQILGDDFESRNAVGLDLYMMAYNVGGKERTTAEYDDLAKAVGFADTKIFPVTHGLHVMEFFKKALN